MKRSEGLGKREVVNFWEKPVGAKGYGWMEPFLYAFSKKEWKCAMALKNCKNTCCATKIVSL